MPAYGQPLSKNRTYKNLKTDATNEDIYAVADTLIGNVGFPIAVSVYLLIRVETKLGDLTGAIGELREAIITLPQNKYWSANPTPTPTSYPANIQPTQ